MYPLDLEQYRAKPKGRPEPAKPKRLPRHKSGEWFIKGPIPGLWISRAASLPGKAIQVGLALWYLAGVGKGREVVLTADALDKLGVNRHAAYRGLEQLRRAGLVSAVRHRGRCPRVTIREVTKQ